MKGRIIGPPVPVLVSSRLDQSVSCPRARLAVAVELDTHVCVAALLPPDVFPLIGSEVIIRRSMVSGFGFDFHIEKE